MRWWRKAAEQGEASAQEELGTAYFFGDGVQRDHSEAAKWFRKAAEQENQTLDAAAQRDFASRFGKLHVHPVYRHVEGVASA